MYIYPHGVAEVAAELDADAPAVEEGVGVAYGPEHGPKRHHGSVEHGAALDSLSHWFMR